MNQPRPLQENESIQAIPVVLKVEEIEHLQGLCALDKHFRGAFQADANNINQRLLEVFAKAKYKAGF